MVRAREWTLVVAAAVVSLVQAGPYDGWKPHAYCNDDVEQTKIEPLTPKQQERVASLEQVQVLARHGARAPYYRLFCWDSKKHNPMDATWNCTTTSVSSQDIGLNPHSGFGRLYRKEYLPGQNILNGNCVVGGLLPAGRQQHLKNGQLIQDAYIGDGPLKIFPHANLSQLPVGKIYLRSDDQERTIGSGQALVDGLFPVDGLMSRSVDHMLTWHVADMATDHVNTNEAICPMMGYIGNISTMSTTYQKHVKDAQTVKVEKDFHEVVGNFSWGTVLECLSVARCNDLPLPDGIDEELFTNVFSEVERRQSLFLTYNNSWYAKVAMQPLLNELITKLDAVLKGEPDAPRLAITMGHDSTLMPFLAALQRSKWERKWTPYAGVFVLELYKSNESKYLVRTLFKGKALEIPECADTLCELDDFMKAVEFSRTPRHCTLPSDATSPADLSGHPFGFSQYLSSFVLLGLAVLCAFLGFRSHRQRRRPAEKTSLLG